MRRPFRPHLLPLMAVLAGVAASLPGCGRKLDLLPVAGRSLPPAPLGAVTTPAPADLMTPSSQSRPERRDELIKQSQQRPVDPFDLPPPG